MKTTGQIEASTISKSQSEVSNNARKGLMLGTTTKLDHLFPLFDQMNQYSTLPKFLYYLCAFYLYYQILFTSFWIYNRFWNGIEGSKRSCYLYLQRIAWFLDIQNDVMYPGIAAIIVFALSFVVILFMIIMFIKNHKVVKWTLYPFRFVFDIVAPIMVNPSAAILGYSIWKYVTDKDAVNWVFIVFGVIMYPFFLFLSYIGITVMTYSTRLLKTPFSSFDQRVMVMQYIVNSVFVLLMFIIALFNDWAMIIVQVLHLVIGLIAYYPIIYLPFHTPFANVMFISINLAAFMNDIIMIILFFFDLSHIIGFVIPFALFVVFAILSAIIIHFVIKKIISIINDITFEGDLKEAEKFAILQDVDLLKTQEKTLMTIHIAFTNVLEHFYDWSLIRYAVTQFPDTRTIMTAIQYLSFFPGESRQLNAIFNNATTRRDLTFALRFFIFEIYKVKLIRQSSISSDANSKLTELKSATLQIYEDIVSFFSHKVSNVAYFEMLADSTLKTHAKWEECIHDYPNNPKFCDEYCSFLIECESSLIEALIIKNRSECIEMGKNFAVDITFRSFIRCYPYYLKRNIVDSSGYIRGKSNIGNHSSRGGGVSEISQVSSTSNSSQSFSSSSSTGPILDAEVEENLSRQLFRQSAIRLGMHRALAHRKSFSSKMMVFSGILAFIITFGSFLGLFIYVDNYANSRTDSLTYLSNSNGSKFYTQLAILEIALKFAYFTGRFEMYDLFQELENTAEESAQFVNIGPDISYDLHNNNILARQYFSDFLSGLAVLSNQGEPIYEIASSMMSQEIGYISCFEGSPTSSVTSSVKAQHSYLFFALDRLSYYEANESWYGIDEVCEIIANQESFSEGYLTVFNSLKDHQINLCEEENKILFILMILFPVVLVIVDIAPLLISTSTFMRDAKRLLSILQELDSPIKEKARSPIRKDSEYEISQTSEKKPKGKKWALLTLAIIIFSIAAALLSWGMVWSTQMVNNDLEKLISWHMYSAARITYGIEALHYMLEAVMLNETFTSNATTQEEMVEKAEEATENLVSLNNILLKGNDEVEPCYEYDSQLDDINFISSCEVPDNNTEIHDTYRCASASQGVGILHNMINTVLREIDQCNGILNHTMIIHALHLVNGHLLIRLYEAVFRIQDLTSIACSTLSTNAVIILIFGIIISIIILILSYAFYSQSIKIYKAGLALIQRIPPTSFMSYKTLLNFILNKRDDQQEFSMSTSQSAIHMSNDAIFCTNGNGVIEMVNPAVTSILGYTPDQLLGQPISNFLTESDGEKITGQIELMKNGQAGLLYEDHMVCITDSALEMQCGITLLGMMNANKNSVESFVIILRDETILMKQQKDAEQAKAQSENLLFQILPRDIVIRLNRGEKDISFTVESASIIFTDVVKFSEYSKNLSPQEIMGSLSTLFATFDEIVKQYNLITKIKLIGDIYMAAAGLFAPEGDPPRNHADQILRFGIDSLNELEEVNLKLNANLQLRIGINSGGPLLAGVLGTDKPVFDIIGDPINVAARLQTTDIPGKIQIPHSTFELIHDSDFLIEPRGEVFLKGKGKTMAYLVSPIQANTMSSFDIMAISKDTGL